MISNIIELIGEDRNYGGNDLFVDLIPSSCWFSNVRTSISRSNWDKLRIYIYERSNYTCECCNINTKEDFRNGRIEAHERWEYNNVTKIQKLKRIIALCHQCHQVTHIGFAKIRGKYEEALNHLQNVNKITFEDCEKHIEESFKLHKERNLISWNLDLSLIENNGFKITNKNYNNNKEIKISKSKIYKTPEESFIASLLKTHKAFINGIEYFNFDEIMKLNNEGNIIDFE